MSSISFFNLENKNQYLLSEAHMDQTSAHRAAEAVWFLPCSLLTDVGVCICVSTYLNQEMKRGATENKIRKQCSRAGDISSCDINELMISSLRIGREFHWLSPMPSHAHRTHLYTGTISVLALSTRREWRPRRERPQRYSGPSSWWSALFCNASDIFSAKATHESVLLCYSWITERRRNC